MNENEIWYCAKPCHGGDPCEFENPTLIRRGLMTGVTRCGNGRFTKINRSIKFKCSCGTVLNSQKIYEDYGSDFQGAMAFLMKHLGHIHDARSDAPRPEGKGSGHHDGTTIKQVGV